MLFQLNLSKQRSLTISSFKLLIKTFSRKNHLKHHLFYLLRTYYNTLFHEVKVNNLPQTLKNYFSTNIKELFCPRDFLAFKENSLIF